MKEQDSKNLRENANKVLGRPAVNQNQKFQLDSLNDGMQIFDTQPVAYASKFGIQGGYTLQEDSDCEPRMNDIAQIYRPYQQNFQAIGAHLKQLRKHEDIIQFLQYATGSMDTIFCKEYTQLLITIFLSLPLSQKQTQEMAAKFLDDSEYFSFKKFRQILTKKKKELRQQDLKIKQKLSKNLQNEKKKNKSIQLKSSVYNRSGKYQTDIMKDIEDEGKIWRQFKKLFINLKTQIKKFIQKPQPFLSQYRLMKNCLYQIMGGHM